MHQVTILFFATLKERAGISRTTISLSEGARVSELKGRLFEMFPGLGSSPGAILVAVNQQYAGDDTIVPLNAEVALFPPVSGGSDFPTLVRITNDELNLNDMLAEITLASTGAACIFTGIVRGRTERGDPHETIYLEYEAYTPMAEARMLQVAQEIRERWPAVEGISIVQRIGRLEPTTPTVLIACTAAHRDTGVFEAARYGIDRLKEIVPIWKKEFGPNGEFWVEGDYIPKQDDL